MLRNAFTDPATDFTAVTNIVLLNSSDEPPASSQASHLYIKFNGLSNNFTIYLQQVGDDESGQSLQVKLPIPRDRIPNAIKEKFTNQTTTLLAGQYQNNPLPDLSREIDSHLRTLLVARPAEEKAESRPYRPYRVTFAERALNFIAYTFGGFFVGAGLGEGFEPLVNQSLGHEFDQQSDMPFFMVTGSAGFFLGMIASRYAPRITDCQVPTSLAGIFGRCRRGGAVAPADLTSNLASTPADTNGLLPRAQNSR